MKQKYEILSDVYDIGPTSKNKVLFKPKIDVAKDTLDINTRF